MNNLVERASFVAITRLIEDRTQLLVEVGSVKHAGLFHAVGGKSEPGERPLDTINRELNEECRLPLVDDSGQCSEWEPLGFADLLGCIGHGPSLVGVPFENHYYLYPKDVKEVVSRDVNTQWVFPEDLTVTNSTYALQDLVKLLKDTGHIQRNEGVNMHVVKERRRVVKEGPRFFSPNDRRRLQQIQEDAKPTSEFMIKVSDGWGHKVKGVRLQARAWWTLDLRRGSDGKRIMPESAWVDLIARLSEVLDRRATDVVRSILHGDVGLVEGLEEIGTAFAATLSQVRPIYTFPIHPRGDANSFKFQGFGMEGIIHSFGEHENYHLLAGLPFGLAEGLQVLLEALDWHIRAE